MGTNTTDDRLRFGVVGAGNFGMRNARNAAASRASGETSATPTISGSTTTPATRTTRRCSRGPTSMRW
jgi:hypothetical protein